MRSPRSRRLTLAALAALLALAGLLVRAPRARAAEACFAETGHCVRGGFLDYWLAHGGLALNGYPLSVTVCAVPAASALVTTVFMVGSVQ